MTTPDREQNPTIWKYTLEEPNERGRCYVSMPQGAQALSVGSQDDQLVVWAKVYPGNAPILHEFYAVNTGREFVGLPPSRFLGTVTASNGIVWHIWTWPQ